MKVLIPSGITPRPSWRDFCGELASILSTGRGDLPESGGLFFLIPHRPPGDHEAMRYAQTGRMAPHCCQLTEL